MMRLQKVVRLALSLSLILAMALGTAACKTNKQTPTNTEDAAHAQKQVSTVVSDYFSYLKMYRFEKVNSLTEEGSTAPEDLSDVLGTSLAASLETACGRIKETITSVEVDLKNNTAQVGVTVNYLDMEYLEELSRKDGKGFASEKELKSAIESVPSEDLRINLELVYEESWLVTEESMDEVYDMLFAFLDWPELISEAPETLPTEPVLGISVYDSYWVDKKGNETSGYHCSDSKLCLYCYTWNTYKNTTIRYEYTDLAGQVLYENTYTISNNSDWICCTWPVSSVLPEGPLVINLYEPAGVLFHTKEVMIYPDGEILPFPMEVVSSYWTSRDGLGVDFYNGDTDYVCYTVQTLNFYKNLKLVYQYLDEEGNVLFEGTFCNSDLTDTFVFSWDEAVLPEEMTVLQLVVKTDKDEPFCQADILIVPVPDPEEMLDPMQTSPST